MSRNKKRILIGAGAAAGLAACTPQVVDVYNDWKAAQRNALIERAELALSKGADAIDWSQDFGLEEGEEVEQAEGGEEKDDSKLRHLAMAAEVGPRPPEFNEKLLRIAREEQQKWSALSAQGAARPAGDQAASGDSPTPAGAAQWVSMGPQASRSSYNGSFYKASNDTGRVNKVRYAPAAPGRPAAVYIASSAGGVWRTTDFGQFPTWAPITDGLGNLAIGSLDVLPGATVGSDLVVVGLGDHVDGVGGAVVRSADSGATWSAPVMLRAAAHPADGQPSWSLSIRDVKVDPTNPLHILAASSDGLYRSMDGGATFALVDLPNSATANGGSAQRREAMWSVQFLGAAGGQTHWLASGVYGCPGTITPAAGAGAGACAGGALGNAGDIWKSTDSGATWTSARAGGLLPATVTAATAADIGRINLSGTTPADPAQAAVYAIAGSMNEAASATNAILKSTDGGGTWTVVATGATAVANPTLGTNCVNMNIGQNQSYYDLAVGVDPGNANNVVVAGSLCAARTRDGGATWENAAHWLPQGGSGYTAQGFLPYAHADWHTFTVVRDGAETIVFGGNDGGLYVTRDVFQRAIPTDITWSNPNIGIVTHLMYSAGSGDPVFGDQRVAMSGLQDNGTRFRLLEDETFVHEYNLQNWDQIRGGDGIGTAVSRGPRGENPVYWISVQGQHLYCQPRRVDCSRATRIENGVESANYRRAQVPAASLPAGDGYPFMIRYSPINDELSSVLTLTNRNVWKLRVTPSTDAAVWTRMTPAGITAAGTVRSLRGLGIHASPHAYTIDGQPARIYTMALSGGGSGIIVDFGATQEVIGATNVVRVADASAPAAGNGFHNLGFIQTVDVPRNPATLGGTSSKQTWLVGSAGAMTQENVLVPDSVGHLLKTTDGGATYVPFHGNGTGRDLPNVPVWVVRYDRSDLTDRTIYVGTDIGLYRTTDGGNTWARYGQGLPQVRIYDLTVASNGSLVRVAAYGRGMWEIFPRSEAGAVPASADWDGNGVVDYFDLSAAAVRLGTTPATVQDPYSPIPRYDAALDASDSNGTIDEADLTSVLGKFGGTP
jgi:photosystem II stability/assembly factor-like uncharacterized protein